MATKSLLFFLTMCFMLVFFCFSSFIPSAIFDWQLSDYLKKVSFLHEVKKSELKELIDGMESKLEFTCSNVDKRILQSKELGMINLTLVGIITKNGDACSSLDMRFALPLELTKIQHKPTGVDDIYFFHIGDLPHTPKKIAIVKESGRGMLFYVLSAEKIFKDVERHCDDCYYAEFYYGDNLAFDVGNQGVKYEESVRTQTESMSPNAQRINVYAGEKLMGVINIKIYIISLVCSGVLLLAFVTIALYLGRREKSLYAKLKVAIANEEFIPYFQPIIDTRFNNVAGAELLIRWNRDGELIYPGDFIPFAEDNGLIIPLTNAFMSAVFYDLHCLPHDLWFSVNISGEHFKDDQFYNSLLDANFPASSQLAFEITERTPIGCVDVAKSQIERLVEKGYGFKLDDFGTGYAGFSYLHALGIKSIKIDKMFVDTISCNQNSTDVLDSIIAFGLESDYEMIAEGVESRVQAEYLISKGVYLHQGFYYSKGIPKKEFVTYLKKCKHQIL